MSAESRDWGVETAVVTEARPPAAPPREYRFPAFSRDRLANGMEVIVARVSRLPLVTIRILVDAGASGDPIERAGLATLTAHALAEGTLRADGAQLAEEFEQLGAALTTSASWDGVHARVTALRDRFPAALALLAEVVLSPSFPDREVARLREERLAELLELRSEPRGLADERFTAFVYRPESRFALPAGGVDGTVSALGRDHCAAFHGSRFRPASTTVIVVGDIDRASALAAVESTFGKWAGVSGAIPAVDARPARISRAIHVVCRRGAPQTELRVGHVGIPRAHPAYFATVVMNAILGGVFNSRINLNLRERNGYTYGASSGFDWRRDAGPFVVSTAVATDVTAAAIRETVNEIERMRSAPPTGAELSLVTSYLEGVFPIRFETTDAIAGALASLKAFGLADDYYDVYRDRVRGITADDVVRAAQEHLLSAQLQIVVVGDPESIGKPLESLGLGPVGYTTPEGEAVSTA